MDEIYAVIPDFGGVEIKADSEGRVGPSKYGRTQSDAANVVARALKPHGGLVLYRGFVYNNHLDWQDRKADRARAGYDNFHPLDGKFDDNVDRANQVRAHRLPGTRAGESDALRTS